MRAMTNASIRSRSPDAGCSSFRAARITTCALELRSVIGIEVCWSAPGWRAKSATRTSPSRAESPGTRRGHISLRSTQVFVLRPHLNAAMAASMTLRRKIIPKRGFSQAGRARNSMTRSARERQAQQSQRRSTSRNVQQCDSYFSLAERCRYHQRRGGCGAFSTKAARCYGSVCFLSAGQPTFALPGSWLPPCLVQSVTSTSDGQPA